MQRAPLTLFFFALVALAAVVEHATDRPPAPRPADAPTTEFSELRARPLLYAFTDGLGKHAVGSAELERATELVANALRAIPGVEVELQDAQGVTPMRRGAIVYSTRNVVARIRGASDEAVLLSAHIDSAAAGEGAADDGMGVATLVEVARALAAGPKLAQSVVLDLNGAEEPGLLGAMGFEQHRWAKDARVFVNVDAAGDAGRAILFRVSPGASWLLDAYADGVRRPFGNVIGQDLFRAGLVPSDTDFHVYTDYARPGVDFAFFEDGYAYHTALDTYARTEPGAMQHLGEETLGLTRALATRVAAAPTKGWPVFYDLFGLHMFHMSNGAAHAAGWLVVLLSLIAVGIRRESIGNMARGAAFTWLSLLAGIALPLVAAAFVGLVLHRSFGWYSAPALAVLAYAPLALAGVLLVGARRTPSAAGALVGSTILLAILVLLDVGSAYLVAWWCLANAIALLVPRAPKLLLWALPVCFSVQVVATLVRLAVPLMGRSGLGNFSELAVAVSIALPIGMALATIATQLPARRASGVFMIGVGAVGLVLCIAHTPYSATRPARVLLEDRNTDGKGELVELDDLHALSPGAAHVTHTLPPPNVTVTRGDVKDGVRSYELTFTSPPATRIEIPRDAVKGWSLPIPVPTPPRNLPLRIVALGGPSKGRVVTLRLDVLEGSHPKVTATTIRSDTTPALSALHLPDTMTVDTYATTTVAVPLD